MRTLDFQEAAVLRIRLLDVDDQEICEKEIRQRMLAVPVGLPARLAVEAVPEGQVGVQARAVGAQVRRGEMETVLHVVDVPDLQITVDLVELLRRQQHVLHLRPTHPLEPDVHPAARQRLGHNADEPGAVEEP
jgi:hypothetical protein